MQEKHCVLFYLDQMNLKIGSSSEEVDRTSNSSWSVCSNSAHGAIGSISSSTSINIDISNMTNSPHNQGKNVLQYRRSYCI